MQKEYHCCILHLESGIWLYDACVSMKILTFYNGKYLRTMVLVCSVLSISCSQMLLRRYSFITFIGDLLYPVDMNCVMCNRSDIKKFAEEAKEIGVQYIGLCCGNAPNMLREVAEVYGRTPEASKYTPDVSENIIIGRRGSEINKEAEKVRRFSLGDAKISIPSLNPDKK